LILQATLYYNGTPQTKTNRSLCGENGVLQELCTPTQYNPKTEYSKLNNPTFGGFPLNLTIWVTARDTSRQGKSLRIEMKNYSYHMTLGML
jgi:hypothetical protein